MVIVIALLRNDVNNGTQPFTCLLTASKAIYINFRTCVREENGFQVIVRWTPASPFASNHPKCVPHFFQVVSRVGGVSSLHYGFP